MAGTRRVRVFISGRVQGVGFRYHTKNEATRLGLTGWVKNLPDGRVEAIAEGPAEAVEKFLTWCWTGPKAARVSEVNAENAEVLAGTASFVGFTIAH